MNFNSIEEMLRTLPKESELTSPRVSSAKFGGAEWRGTDTYEEAEALATAGWAEGRSRIGSAFVEIKGRMEDKVKSFAFAEEGIDLDVGAFMTGEPECFIAPSFKEAEAPIRILVSFDVSSSIELDFLFRRGAAICAIIDGLEQQGKRVELVACAGIKGLLVHLNFSVLVKPANAPLDMDRVAFVLCNAAMFRRFLFRFIEWKAPQLTKVAYGFPAEFKTEEVFDIVFDSIKTNSFPFDTPANAAEWAAQQVNKLNK